MDLIQIGKRIKQCRKRQHLTQECLAECILRLNSATFSEIQST